MGTSGYLHISWLLPQMCIYCLSVIVHLSKVFQRRVSSTEAEFFIETWLDSFIFSIEFCWVTVWKWKKKKTITGVFCMVAPKNHIKLLGLFPLAWTGGEESLKFLQLNWKKRQRVKVVKHRSETPSSVLLYLVIAGMGPSLLPCIWCGVRRLKLAVGQCWVICCSTYWVNLSEITAGFTNNGGKQK